MEKNNISQIIVLKKGKYAGIVHIHEIIKEGVV
jgi:arabinose-5-phosphate isomerase